MEKFVLTSIYSASEGGTLGYSLIKEIGFGWYIEPKEDGTIDVFADMDKGVVNCKVENGEEERALVGAGAKYVIIDISQDQIKIKVGSDIATFTVESKAEELGAADDEFADEVAAYNEEEEAERQREAEELKAIFDEERKTEPRRYTVIGKVEWVDGKQVLTNNADVRKDTLAIYGSGEGKHLVATTIEDLGEGYWEEGYMPSNRECKFGDVSADIDQDDVDENKVFVSIGDATYHCQMDGMEIGDAAMGMFF